MKLCPKCGAQDEDDAAFCVKCGAPFAQEAQQPPQEPNRWDQPVQPQQPPMPWNSQVYDDGVPGLRPMPGNPVVNLIKQSSTAPLFIVGAAIYTAMLVLNLWNILTEPSLSTELSNIWSSNSELFGSVPYNSSTLFNDIAALVRAIQFVALVLPLLICIGLWMHYAASRNTLDAGLRTGGLSMIKVSTVVTFVFACIALFLGFLVLVAAVVTVADPTYYEGSDVAFAEGAVIGVMLLLAVVAVLAIIYFVKLISLINRVVTSSYTGQPRLLPVYVPVMNFVVAFFSLFGLILSLHVSGAPGILASVLGMAASVIFSVCVIRYNSATRDMMYRSAPRPTPPPPMYGGYQY